MTNLKAILFLMFTVGVFSTSCSQDDGLSGEIKGKWFFVKEGVVVAGYEVLKNHENAKGCSKDFIEINESGGFRDVSYQEIGCVEMADVGKWTKQRHTLTLTYTYDEGEQNEVEVVSILLLTDSKLKLKTIHKEAGKDVTTISLFIRAK